MNKSNIDYLKQAEAAIGRPGYTLNIVTGCKHGCPYCYARRMVEHGRLKGNKAYPYGFEPTFHPGRIRKYGGKPKLIFCNDMGDVGGDWWWKTIPNPHPEYDYTESTSLHVAKCMRQFATFNSQHRILLLTKRPEFYGLVEWPSNVWLGFSATNNAELHKHWFGTYPDANIPANRSWVSCEPWLDDKPPNAHQMYTELWLVIGGLSGPNARPVSEATLEWLKDDTVQAKRFTKRNAYTAPKGYTSSCVPREYPDEWKVNNAQ